MIPSATALKKDTQHREKPAATAEPYFRVLGVKVHAVQIPGVIRQIEEWIARRGACRYVAVTGMHGIMEAQHDAQFKRVLNEADLVVPDGMPLVWIGRLRGHDLRRRVYGPELMLGVCKRAGYRHFLYGGDVGVAEALEESLAQACGRIDVVGSLSPPFRELTAEEDANVVEMINAARPDVLWVGLSTPKQEKWMHEHRGRLQVPVMIGVGAAFDFLSARKKQAPAWMREHGLEWLFRLLQEPGRLWRRYILNGAEFVFLVGLELLGLRRYEADEQV